MTNFFSGIVVLGAKLKANCLVFLIRGMSNRSRNFKKNVLKCKKYSLHF